MLKFDIDATFADDRLVDITIYFLLFLFSVLVFSMYGLELPLQRDNAQYVYTGERLLYGEMPYQSLFDMKTPLTSFAAAFALLISQNLFDDPITGVRLFFIAVAIATILLTYTLAKKLFKNRFEALLPPLMMIGFHGYVFQAAVGARPKELLLLFFVTGLIFLLDKRWFLLGLIAAVCSFTWQPSGILFIAAMTYAFTQRPPDRFHAVSRLIVGFAIPSAIIFCYFLWNGALKELLQGTFVIHLYLSRPEESEIWNIIKMFPLGYPFSFILIIVSLATFFVHGLRRVINRGPATLSDDPYFPFTIMLCLFSIASLLDFQGYEDFFIFLPFSALGILLIYRWAVGLATRGDRPTSPAVVRSAFLVVLLAIPFLNAAFSDALSSHTAIWRGALKEQKQAYADIVWRALGSYDANSKIVVIGVPEIPALLGFRNGTQYACNPAMHGYDDFIASNYSNGFAGWLEELSRQKPDLVIVKLSDIRGYTRQNRALLSAWLNSQYSKVASNEGIASEKFRSKGIDAWVRNE